MLLGNREDFTLNLNFRLYDPMGTRFWGIVMLNHMPLSLYEMRSKDLYCIYPA